MRTSDYRWHMVALIVLLLIAGWIDSNVWPT